MLERNPVVELRLSIIELQKNVKEFQVGVSAIMELGKLYKEHYASKPQLPYLINSQDDIKYYNDMVFEYKQNAVFLDKSRNDAIEAIRKSLTYIVNYVPTNTKVNIEIDDILYIIELQNKNGKFIMVLESHYYREEYPMNIDILLRHLEVGVHE